MNDEHLGFVVEFGYLCPLEVGDFSEVLECANSGVINANEKLFPLLILKVKSKTIMLKEWLNWKIFCNDIFYLNRARVQTVRLQ